MSPGRRDHELADALGEGRPRLRGEAGVGDEDVGVLEAREADQAADAPFRVIGDRDDPAGRGDQRLVGLGLEQVRRREARVGAHAVHAHEEHVDVQRAEGRDCDRADQRVGRGAARRPSGRR